MDTAMQKDPLNGTLKFIFGWMGPVYLIGILFIYHLLVGLYNISPLHPLYKFPGPKLAAASYIYEAYYDLWLFGRYTNRIREMHNNYGPIIRISPDELHCSDPNFTDEIYTGSGNVCDRWQHQLNGHGTWPVSISMFGTVPHELHRMRRGAVSKYFSRQQIVKIEHEIHELAQKLVDKMLAQAGRVFGEPMRFVSQDSWEPNFTTWSKAILESTFKMRFVVPLRLLAEWFPWISNYLGEDMRTMMEYLNVLLPRYINKALDYPEKGGMFADMVDSNALPESEKSMSRLSGEGLVFLIAGTETTSAVLTVITYYLLSQPKIYARLMDELQDVDPSDFKWTDLESRPYFWALIHESLRVMPGFSGRSARVARDRTLFYKSQDGMVEWAVPKNTPIGMSSIINHWNSDIFPRPNDFVPERWLIDGKPNHKLQNVLISFSKGSRSCIGKNLAYCELYVITVLIAYRIVPRARLYETTVNDISYDHEAIVPQAKKGSISVRIEVKGA